MQEFSLLKDILHHQHLGIMGLDFNIFTKTIGLCRLTFVMSVRYSSTWWSLLWQPARSCHTSPRRASGMPLRTKAGSCLGRTDKFICLREGRRRAVTHDGSSKDIHFMSPVPASAICLGTPVHNIYRKNIVSFGSTLCLKGPWSSLELGVISSNSTSIRIYGPSSLSKDPVSLTTKDTIN